MESEWLKELGGGQPEIHLLDRVRFSLLSGTSGLAGRGGESKSLKRLLENTGLHFSTLSVTSLPTDLLVGSKKASGVAGQLV